jgi:hypothetical protein
VTRIETNPFGWNPVIQAVTASNVRHLTLFGVKGKVKTVISEMTIADWMKAHRKFRNEYWYADGEVTKRLRSEFPKRLSLQNAF